MIGRIRGEIIDISEALVLIDIGGLGYEVEIPLSTYTALGAVADEVTLHTHLVVREDAQLLYGFYTLAERELFRSLIKVNKVGPKLAITILSGGDPASFVRVLARRQRRSWSSIWKTGCQRSLVLIWRR